MALVSFPLELKKLVAMAIVRPAALLVASLLVVVAAADGGRRLTVAHDREVQLPRRYTRMSVQGASLVACAYAP